MTNALIDTYIEKGFAPLQISHLPLLKRYIDLAPSRTCDYTIGGIYLWRNVFSYGISLLDHALIICGRQENNLSLPALSLPLCREQDLADTIDTLRLLMVPLRFSAIPEDSLHHFAEIAPIEINELDTSWSDYLYDIQAIASLQGNAMKKKRNHLNRYLADHPDARLEPLRPEPCLHLLERIGHDQSSMGAAEFTAVHDLLTHWSDLSPYFTAAMLVAGEQIHAFTIGETKADTLHVHIEKADHTISGSGETITSLFARRELQRNPHLAYVNRQDNAGDPGLRTSKESWHPLRLLPKFNLLIP